MSFSLDGDGMQLSSQGEKGFSFVILQLVYASMTHFALVCLNDINKLGYFLKMKNLQHLDGTQLSDSFTNNV